jgi:hypothetical protein
MNCVLCCAGSTACDLRLCYRKGFFFALHRSQFCHRIDQLLSAKQGTAAWHALTGHKVWIVLTINSLRTGPYLAGDLAMAFVFGYNVLTISAADIVAVQPLILGCLARRWLYRPANAG